jgi:hypothetical protein
MIGGMVFSPQQGSQGSQGFPVGFPMGVQDHYMTQYVGGLDYNSQLLQQQMNQYYQDNGHFPYQA